MSDTLLEDICAAQHSRRQYESTKSIENCISMIALEMVTMHSHTFISLRHKLKQTTRNNNFI